MSETRAQRLKTQRANARRHQEAIDSAIDSLMAKGSSETINNQTEVATAEVIEIGKIAQSIYNIDPELAYVETLVGKELLGSRKDAVVGVPTFLRLTLVVDWSVHSFSQHLFQT